MEHFLKQPASLILKRHTLLQMNPIMGVAYGLTASLCWCLFWWDVAAILSLFCLRGHSTSAFNGPRQLHPKASGHATPLHVSFTHIQRGACLLTRSFGMRPFFWHVQVQMSDFLRIVYIVGSRYHCSGKHEHISDLVCPCNAQNGVVNSLCRKCSARVLA